MNPEDAVWMCKLGITPRYLEDLRESEYSDDEICQQIKVDCGWDVRVYEIQWLIEFLGLDDD